MFCHCYIYVSTGPFLPFLHLLVSSLPGRGHDEAKPQGPHVLQPPHQRPEEPQHRATGDLIPHGHAVVAAGQGWLGEQGLCEAFHGVCHGLL